MPFVGSEQFHKVVQTMQRWVTFPRGGFPPRNLAERLQTAPWSPSPKMVQSVIDRILDFGLSKREHAEYAAWSAHNMIINHRTFFFVPSLGNKVFIWDCEPNAIPTGAESSSFPGFGLAHITSILSTEHSNPMAHRPISGRLEPWKPQGSAEPDFFQMIQKLGYWQARVATENYGYEMLMENFEAAAQSIMLERQRFVWRQDAHPPPSAGDMLLNGVDIRLICRRNEAGDNVFQSSESDDMTTEEFNRALANARSEVDRQWAEETARLQEEADLAHLEQMNAAWNVAMANDDTTSTCGSDNMSTSDSSATYSPRFAEEMEE